MLCLVVISVDILWEVEHWIRRLGQFLTSQYNLKFKIPVLIDDILAYYHNNQLVSQYWSEHG